MKKLMSGQTVQPRQTWRQQLDIMTKWASEHNQWVAQQKGNGDGR